MPLKVALVGFGHMGRIHFQKALASEDAEIAGVADIRGEPLREIEEKHGLPTYTDYRDLVGKVKGVIISSPTETHYEIAKAFLEGGSHVFIEKPITVNPHDAKELIAIAAGKGVILQIGHSERFNPALVKARKHIKHPLFLNASRLAPFSGRSTDVNVVHDLMIHDIDLMLTLIRDDIREVRAHGSSLVTESIDIATAWVEFVHGSLAILTASRMALGRERYIDVYEASSYTRIDLLAAKVTTSRKDPAGGMESAEETSDIVDPVGDEIREFIEVLKGETNPTVTGEDGLKALVLADQITHYIVNNSKSAKVI